MTQPFLHSAIGYEDLEEGRFQCPDCGQTQDYALRRGRRVVMAGRFKVCGLEPLVVQVHCKACQGTWGKEVLQQDPKKKEREWNDDFFFACMDCWLGTALADGDFSPREMEAFMAAARSELGRDLDADKILERAHMLRESPSLAGYFLGRILARVSDVGRESILRGAWQIAHAEGQIREATDTHLAKLIVDLRMSDAHVNGLVMELKEHGSEA